MVLLTAGAGACRPLATGPAGGGAAGAANQPSALVGTWRRTVILETATDITTSETTWLFGADGACERVLATTSIAAGFTDTVRSPCRWTAAGTTVTIQFDGAGATQFSWAVQGSTLLLNGVPFERI